MARKPRKTKKKLGKKIQRLRRSEGYTQEELRENAEALKDASLYVYVTVKDLAEKVPEFAEDSGKATMRGLGKEALSRLRNPAWEPFYKTVAELYGELSPQDFINSVVLRIVPKKQEAKEEVEKRKAEKRRIIEKLTPIDLRPVDELCLCNKLLRPETIARIKTEVLNGQEPEVIARKHGWKSDLTTPEAFETSRKKMAKRRDNRIPTEEEARFSNWVIQKLLLRLSESRRGWHMIDKEYTAFRFVFYLMPELRGESNSVGKLIDALYPKKEYLTDASRSFLLLGIDES